MLRFASLGSGSRGNATLVQSNKTLLLVDCGFTLRETEQRLQQCGVSARHIDAVLVTHEHGDHMRGVGPLARRYDLPVLMTHGTFRTTDYGKLSRLRFFGTHDQTFTVGDIEVTPVAVPHDAREPSQFVFRHANQALGLLTDLGCITPHLIECYAELDALLLECNHDVRMLARGPYPLSLQKRVGGNYGHLNNAQAAELLSQINYSRLQHLVAGHLSEKNNTPELAQEALLGVDNCISSCLDLLDQGQVSRWYELN